jgi:hypothetical protein
MSEFIVEPPALSEMGERLQERTEPLAPEDGEHGWAHLLLCEAMGGMAERVTDVFDPPDPMEPGAPLLSIDWCPDWALPWLAQLVGVKLPDSLDPEDQRVMIRDVAGWSRGTSGAMRAAAGFYLTGSKTVYFRERNGSPYRIEVVTRTGETPDPAAVLASLLRQKPAGLALTYRTVEGWDYEEMTFEGGTYLQQKAAYLTYRALQYKEPT